MGKVIMAGAMSLDGYIADASDNTDALFEWFGNGDVALATANPRFVFQVSQATAEYMGGLWRRSKALVLGRRQFDLGNGFEGQPPVGEAIFVVTHAAPADWPFPDAPITFVTDGVASAIAQARAYAGDGDVLVASGNVGGQAFAAGLIDEVSVDLVPVILGAGRPFFGDYAGAPRFLEDPEIVPGTRVMHLLHRVRR
jgi:dihydrofolate reductase